MSDYKQNKYQKPNLQVIGPEAIYGPRLLKIRCPRYLLRHSVNTSTDMK
jgi:hypothetical protein